LESTSRFISLAYKSCLDSPPQPSFTSQPILSVTLSPITPSLCRSRLKTYLFNKSFPPQLFFFTHWTAFMVMDSQNSKNDHWCTNRHMPIPRLYQQCTNRQKQSKDSQTAKKWPLVYQSSRLHRVRRIHKAAQTPLPCETSITRAWPVATARRPWAGLTVCLHGRPCVWLPFAAACCYSSLLPTDDACSSSSLLTNVIKFSIFSDPILANFLLSRPNSAEYGNSKTTTLLHSAKCTRSLFQDRTG